MHRISSNLTLFLKIFLPTLWVAFFGAFTLAIVLSNVEQFPLFNFFYFKLGLAAFFLTGCTLFYFTFFQLKRVELDKQYLYASNYFKTYRYSYDSIEKITERDLGIFHLVKTHLKEPGKFGKRITFILDEAMLNDFLEKTPEVATILNGFRKKN